MCVPEYKLGSSIILLDMSVTLVSSPLLLLLMPSLTLMMDSRVSAPLTSAAQVVLVRPREFDKVLSDFRPRWRQAGGLEDVRGAQKSPRFGRRRLGGGLLKGRRRVF